MHIIMHAVCRHCKGRNTRILLCYLCNGRKIRAVNIGDRRTGQGNKAWFQFGCRFFDIMDKLLIISHDRIDFCQT